MTTSPQTRAIDLLNLAAQYLLDNQPEGMVIVNGIETDYVGLATDLQNAADDLEKAKDDLLKACKMSLATLEDYAKEKRGTPLFEASWDSLDYLRNAIAKASDSLPSQQ